MCSQPAVRNPRYSVIAAINVRGIVAYDIVSGSMNGRRLYMWTYYRLLQHCTAFPGPNSVLILDNVGFHRNRIFRRIVQFHGARLMYLPPYSPHLNVIELLFNALKQHLRKYPLICEENVRALAHLIMQRRLHRIQWDSVCRKIGYQYHVTGLP